MDKTNNKKTLFIVIAAFVLVTVVVLGVSFALNTDNNPLRNQKVNGLSFENAKVEYKNNTSTFSVIVYNENKEVYDAKNISVNISTNDGEKVDLVSKLEMPLESDEGRLITITSDKDITGIKTLEYEIEK